MCIVEFEYNYAYVVAAVALGGLVLAWGRHDALACCLACGEGGKAAGDWPPVRVVWPNVHWRVQRDANTPRELHVAKHGFGKSLAPKLLWWEWVAGPSGRAAARPATNDSNVEALGPICRRAPTK